MNSSEDEGSFDSQATEIIENLDGIDDLGNDYVNIDEINNEEEDRVISGSVPIVLDHNDPPCPISNTSVGAESNVNDGNNDETGVIDHPSAAYHITSTAVRDTSNDRNQPSARQGRARGRPRLPSSRLTRPRHTNEQSRFPLLRKAIGCVDLPPEYKLSPFDKICVHCGALLFKEELTKIRQPESNLCCMNGKICLKPDGPTSHFYLRGHPPRFEELLKEDSRLGRFYRKYIRLFNNGMAMASLQVSPDRLSDSPIYRRTGGPNVIRLYHTTLTIISDPTGHERPSRSGQSRTPKFQQLIFLEPREAMDIRLYYFDQQAKAMARNIFEMLENLLRENHNPYIDSFLSMKRLIEREQATAQRSGRNQPRSIKLTFKYPDNRRGLNNRPTSDDVAAVYTEDEASPSQMSFTLYHPASGRQYREIDYIHPQLDGLLYPLLFPYGEFSWNLKIPYIGNRQVAQSSGNQRFMTMMEFSRTRLMRKPQFSLILNSGLLSQQYICDLFVRMEKKNLHYIRNELQDQIRIDTHQALSDAMNNTAEDDDDTPHGRAFRLPSTWHGGARYMQTGFLDSLSLVLKFGKPDYFITMTFNPKWLDELPFGNDRSSMTDMIARIFNIKSTELIKDIFENKILGNVIAYTYTIEWQKRGLPHMHLLMIMAEQDKPRSADVIDRIIFAEIPDRNLHPLLYEIVTKQMVHGPCGEQDPDAVCMDESKRRCTKSYPKQFTDETIYDGVSGYPVYRRRVDNRTIEKRVHGVPVLLDNRYIVPYNPYLLAKYNCHINIEICNTLKSVKYLHKYVYKGNERTEVNLHGDEITRYINARYCSAPEAAWRLFSFRTNGRSHSIKHLTVHLPGQQTIIFRTGREHEALARSEQASTTLLAFFALNRSRNRSRDLYYIDVPESFTFKNNQWVPRRSGFERIIGRIHTVSPRDQERFALRLLLLNVPSPISYDSLKTVGEVIHQTFREAAKQRGLLHDPQVWHQSMEEVCLVALPKQIRYFFAMILMHNELVDGAGLWNAFKDKMSEDYMHTRNIRRDRRIHDGQSIEGLPTDEHCEAQALRDINIVLHANGFDLSNFQLVSPVPFDQLGDIVQDELEDYGAEGDRLMRNLNGDQKRYHEKIMNSINQPANGTLNRLFFLDGPGGTGKTTVIKSIIHRCHRDGKRTLVVAPTGIAATLLKGGTTVHSAFNVPLELNEDSIGRITPRSEEGRKIQESVILIWDEAPMSSKLIVSAVDRAMQDVRQNNSYFGGIVVLFCGDFRQVLPVIPRAGRAEIIHNCLKFHPVWPDCEILKLSRNMRAENDSQFAEWILKIGSDSLPTHRGDYIEMPGYFLHHNGRIEDWVFGDQSIDGNNQQSCVPLLGKIVLCVRNETCDIVNHNVLQKLNTEEKIFKSIDTVEAEDRSDDQIDYPTELLNTIKGAGIPHHKLVLKKGSVVMILRNLDKYNGLCNGTRVNIISLTGTYLKVRTEGGKIFYIPRIDFIFRPQHYPVKMRRRQYPVKLAFSTTINKSQGQTFDTVGIDLTYPVFSHGQLYVAMSRVRGRERVKIQLPEDNSDNGYLFENNKYYIKNVVYEGVIAEEVS